MQPGLTHHYCQIWTSVCRRISRLSISSWSPSVPEQKSMRGRGWKDQSSRCWAVRPAEKWESRETKPATLGRRKSRAPIFRAVLCDNLLCFSCAEIQKASLLNCVGTAAVKEETVHRTLLLLAFLLPAILPFLAARSKLFRGAFECCD